MHIIGEKVLLRAIEESDSELLLEMINDPEVERAVGGWSFPSSSYSHNEWFKRQATSTNALRCIIESLLDGRAVGVMSLLNIDYKNGTASSNVKLSKNSQSKGYGIDANRAMFKYAFNELRLNCIYADVLENNIACLKVCEKLGFKTEGILRQRVFKQGKYLNVISLSLLRDEFL